MESRIITRSSWSFMNGHDIDDADDRGIDRRRLPAQRFACRAPFEHDQHLFVHAGADRVDGDNRPAARLAIHRQWLDNEQLDAGEVFVLASSNDVADHFSQLHWTTRNSELRIRNAECVNEFMNSEF